MTIAFILMIALFVFSCFAVMIFVFAFLAKEVAQSKYNITENLTLGGMGNTQVVHLDDENKEHFILKKAENDVKNYILRHENVLEENLTVMASAIVEMTDENNSVEYTTNIIIYLKSNNSENQDKYYFKYCAILAEDKGGIDTSKITRCTGCGSELSGKNKCKYCGMLVTEQKLDITTVEIYKINK